MARSRAKSKPSPQRLILDSGALIALSRGEARVRTHLARALEIGARVEVPVVVVAETLRGGPRDAPIHRLLEYASVPPATEAAGRIAGRLLGQAGSSETVDALVVAHAILGGGAVVLTGDRDDLETLAARNPEVWVHEL